MLEHFQKVNIYMTQNPFFTKLYRSRLIHILRCGIFAIVTGTTAISSPGDCSSPIQVFLEGLFGIYIAGLFINVFVGFTRCINNNLTDSIYKKTFNSLVKSLEVVFIPIFWGFSLVEFIWYVCGAVWYFQESNCSSEYSQGTLISIALIGLWIAWYVISLISIGCFHWYVKENVSLEEAQKQQAVPNIEVKNEGLTKEPSSPLKSGYPTPAYTDPYSPNPSYSKFPERPYSSQYPARNRPNEDSRFSGYPPPQYDEYSNPLSPADMSYNQYPDRNFRTDKAYPPQSTYSGSPKRIQKREYDPYAARTSPPRYDQTRSRESFPGHPSDLDSRISYPSEIDPRRTRFQDTDPRQTDSYPSYPSDIDPNRSRTQNIDPRSRESYPSNPSEIDPYSREYYENPLAPVRDRSYPSSYTQDPRDYPSAFTR